MRPVSELCDFVANGAHLLFGGVRLHDDQHKFTLKKRLAGRRLQEKPLIQFTVARSAPQIGHNQV
jgi:hypothetical protein